MPEATTEKMHRVCTVNELPDGARKIIQAGKVSIGVFNIKGEYFAIRNTCPHQLAPLCLGRVSGTTLPSAVGEYRYGHEGEIVRCPWHKWEFNIKTGKSVFNPHKLKVRSYEILVEKKDGSTCPRTDSGDDPDPTLDTYPVEIENETIYVLI